MFEAVYISFSSVVQSTALPRCLSTLTQVISNSVIQQVYSEVIASLMGEHCTCVVHTLCIAAADPQSSETTHTVKRCVCMGTLKE